MERQEHSQREVERLKQLNATLRERIAKLERELAMAKAKLISTWGDE
jgi:hypothetical protein